MKARHRKLSGPNTQQAEYNDERSRRDGLMLNSAPFLRLDCNCQALGPAQYIQRDAAANFVAGECAHEVVGASNPVIV
jgi:hypothetical protein